MATTQLDADTASRLNAKAHELLDAYHLPGISIGLVRGDELVYSEAFGYADIESKAPASLSRHQRIASISKTLTGLCAMALVDEGHLSLDSRVVDLLPDVAFDGPAEAMTLRHLLTHTSGIGEAPTPDALAATIDPNARSGGDAGLCVDLPPRHHRGGRARHEVGIREPRLCTARRDRRAHRGDRLRCRRPAPHLRSARHARLDVHE